MSAQPASPTTVPTPPSSIGPTITERVQRWVFSVLMVLMWLLTLVVCIALPAQYLWDRYGAEHAQGHARAQAAVMSVHSAGHVLAITLIQGCSTRSLVQTDVGFYTLAKGVSLERDKPLTLEQRSGDERYLCDDQHRCTRLL